MANPKRKIDRVIKSHRKWLADIAQDVFRRSVDDIIESLNEESVHSLLPISTSLHGLATYYGIKGAISVFDANLSGWNDVHTSCHCHLLSLKMWDTAYKRLAAVPALTLNSSEAASSLCYAIACDLENWADVQFALLSDIASESDSVSDPFWKERRFEPFVLRLRQIMENPGQQVLSDGEDFGVYTDVLAHWNNDVSLGNAFVRICDYHCENMDDDGGDWKPEFGEAPFDLIPWELLAIGRIRQLAGLIMPTINHPLAKPMMMQFEKSAQIQDETLSRVEAFYRQVLAPQ